MLRLKITSKKAYNKLYDYYKRHPNKRAKFVITDLDYIMCLGLPNVTYEAYDSGELNFHGCKIDVIESCQSISGNHSDIQYIREVRRVRLNNSRINGILNCLNVVLYNSIVYQAKTCYKVNLSINSIGCFSDISCINYFGGRLIAYDNVNVCILLNEVHDSDLIQLYNGCTAYNQNNIMPTIELYNYSSYIYNYKPEKEKLHINSPLVRVLDWTDIGNTYIAEKLYKIVDIVDGEYSSIHDPCYTYSIGEECDPDKFDADPNKSCSNGIHLASQAWCLNHYNTSKIDALLEFEICDDADICIPYDSDGKIRVSKAKCIREVPREEWDVFGGNI